MTDKKEVAQAVMNEFYSTFANERRDFIIQKLNNDAVANVLRELVFELQYYNCLEGEDFLLDARAILDVCDELENL
jgi:hypothetical protein